MRPNISDICASDLMPSERRVMMAQTIIALACVPVYYALPGIFGLLMGPYVMWLVLKPNRALILPLAIHLMAGSQQRYMALAACFIYCVINIDLMIRRRLLLMWILYVAALPFFIWYTIERYKAFGGGIGAGGTFEGLGYYLGLSWFFWGALAFNQIGLTVHRGLLVMSAVVIVLFSFLFGGVVFSRFLFWAAPYTFAFAFWWFLNRHEYKRTGLYYFLCFCCILVIAGLLGFVRMKTTFTLIGICFLSVGYLFVEKRLKKLLFFMTPLLLLGLSTFYMFSVIDTWDMYYRGHGESISYDEIKIRDWESFKYKLTRKTMTDRAPVWAASMDAVKKQFERDPIFVDVYSLSGGYDLDDGTSIELSVAAHNMLLEMLRLYGLWGGLGIYLVYILLPSLPRVMKALTLLRGTYYAPMLACCLATIVVGGQTGQYPISPQFTFYLFGFMGMCVAAANDVCQRRTRVMVY